MTVKRMDNVGIVVEDIDAAIGFFTALGLELEGRAQVEGDWADGVTGLRGMRVEMAGELLHQKIEQSQASASASSLEENQAGFSGSLEGEYKKSSAELRLGMRSVTQTIRGDILQGRTTDLSMQGRTIFRDKSALALRLSVSKYSLDTRRISYLMRLTKLGSEMALISKYKDMNLHRIFRFGQRLKNA